jgi:hypothetical protein
MSGTWRVYRTEWVTVYTSTDRGAAGGAEAQRHYAETYEGRVRQEDAQFVIPVGQERVLPPVTLQLRKPNLHSEWKDEPQATMAAAGIGPEVHVVLAGSPEERVLLDYGVKKLPDA